MCVPSLQLHVEVFLFLGGKYREIQVKYNRGDFVGAGKLLVDLLESGTVPKKYELVLLDSV